MTSWAGSLVLLGALMGCGPHGTSPRPSVPRGPAGTFPALCRTQNVAARPSLFSLRTIGEVDGVTWALAEAPLQGGWETQLVSLAEDGSLVRLGLGVQSVQPLIVTSFNAKHVRILYLDRWEARQAKWLLVDLEPEIPTVIQPWTRVPGLDAASWVRAMTEDGERVVVDVLSETTGRREHSVVLLDGATGQRLHAWSGESTLLFCQRSCGFVYREGARATVHWVGSGALQTQELNLPSWPAHLHSFHRGSRAVLVQLGATHFQSWNVGDMGLESRGVHEYGAGLRVCTPDEAGCVVQELDGGEIQLGRHLVSWPGRLRMQTLPVARAGGQFLAGAEVFSLDVRESPPPAQSAPDAPGVRYDQEMYRFDGATLIRSPLAGSETRSDALPWAARLGSMRWSATLLRRGSQIAAVLSGTGPSEAELVSLYRGCSS